MKIIDISYLVEAIHTAATMGVDRLIIEPVGIRGIDEGGIVVLFQSGQLPFGNIGLTSVKSLSKQLKIFTGSQKIHAQFCIHHHQMDSVEEQVSILKEFKISFDVSEYSDKEKARIHLINLIDEKMKILYKDKETLVADNKITASTEDKEEMDRQKIEKDMINEEIKYLNRKLYQLDITRVLMAI